MTTAPDPALLVLEDGATYCGTSFAAAGPVFGEAVFATAMTGYQETLTDPSYCGQIIIMTAPHIGNTGMNTTDEESRRIWARGFVVREPSRTVSNWRSERTLTDDLVRDSVAGVAGIDTRALTRHLRDKGAMRAGIFTGADAHRRVGDLVDLVRASPPMAGSNLSLEVSTSEPYRVPATSVPEGRERPYQVVAIDLGIKSMTPEQMAARGMDVLVLPAGTTVDELQALHRGTTAGGGIDGLFLSNGPGDPATADHAVALVQWALDQSVPVFGICFGNQILGRALGFGTYKLPFGHRGINQPVMDRETGRVEITAQNHGFAVDAPIDEVVDTPFGRAVVSHVGINDNVVEGLRCLDAPAFSVQYHPEAAAGPHDSNYLFDRFEQLMTDAKDGQHA